MMKTLVLGVLTALTLACGSIGKVTSEISQRSTFSSRRSPLRGSLRARCERKPIESPSTAPSRISACSSRARATASESRPRT